jgi:hypothetical protein
MSSEKRPASEDYSSSQMVVKRPNLGKDSKAVAVISGSGGNGALMQAVCISLTLRVYMLNGAEESDADTCGIGTTDDWSSSSCYGVDWTFGGSILCKV